MEAKSRRGRELRERRKKNGEEKKASKKRKEKDKKEAKSCIKRKKKYRRQKLLVSHERKKGRRKGEVTPHLPKKVAPTCQKRKEKKGPLLIVLSYYYRASLCSMWFNGVFRRTIRQVFWVQLSVRRLMFDMFQWMCFPLVDLLNSSTKRSKYV